MRVITIDGGEWLRTVEEFSHLEMIPWKTWDSGKDTGKDKLPALKKSVSLLHSYLAILSRLHPQHCKLK